MSIPAWFVLTPDAFFASLSEAERRALHNAIDAGRAPELLAHVTLSSEVCHDLMQALIELCPSGETVAVRSSGDEDEPRYSFAGQLKSFLFVPPPHVPDRVAAVWRSAFGPRVLAYRREHGLATRLQPPAVLIQRMVDGQCSGVAFGADPVSGRQGVAVVAAVYGMGTLLVSGESDADTYHVDREGRILRRDIAYKRFAHRRSFDAKGIRTVEVAEEEARKPALSDDQIRAVAALARQAGRHFGRPQDIEWTIEDGRLYLLQSRPITALALIADPNGVLNRWDNNVAEGYGGITTPLTFSFTRRAHAAVYRHLWRIMGVPAVAAHDHTLQCLCGLIRGRMYDNLLSWYRIVALLPGFTVNRRIMEQMLGVEAGLSEGLLHERERAGWPERCYDALRLVRTAARLLTNYLFLPYRIARSYQGLEEILESLPVGLEEMPADEIAAHYHENERRLATCWDAPIINDFFAMIGYNVLRRLTEKWCGDREGTLQNDLLCGLSGMISAEPAARLREMACLAADSREFVALLCAGSLDEILGRMDELPLFKARYDAYLKKFGDRCLNDPKLESATLHDDPLMLLRAAGQLASSLGARVGDAGTAPAETEPPEARAAARRRRAEQRIADSLRLRPLRRMIFSCVLRQVRAGIRERENLRFVRTRVFGFARRIFVELGRRFHALDLLDAPGDIFYLEVDEIFGFIDGTTTCTDLKGLAAVRRAEFTRYAAEEPPADQFETRGVVHLGNTFRSGGAAVELASNRREGIGCCPGVARGRVRVILNPRTAKFHAGEILVAERLDPGWVMFFPFALGLLVEHGSPLSHSAIVAREIDIPAVVSLSGATSWLRDGDWVELDGSSGVVCRLEGSPETVGHAS